MNELKTAKQFYQASLENLNKASELHEATDATSRKAVALFSRFIDSTKPISGDVELAARNNLKAIQQRDVFTVINSILALVADSSSFLIVSFNFGTLPDGTMSFYVIAWENTEERETKFHEHADLMAINALEQCIQLESKLAEIIIEAKDSAEVTA